MISDTENPIERLDRYLSNAISAGFKELLETKHLYQNHKVLFPDFEKVGKDVIRQLLAGSTHPFTADLSRAKPNDLLSTAIKSEWAIHDPAKFRRTGGYIVPGDPGMLDENTHTISFTPAPVRILCSHCESLEPFNFIGGGDLLKEYFIYYLAQDRSNYQVYYLVYHCQRCKDFPEVFLVKRDEDKLQLTGRNPMEKVPIALFIPKKQRNFFSDAVIAFNSGQALAANFLLRTFIEQFVRSRSHAPNPQDIEVIFEEYMAELPEDFKRRFPSLYAIYGYLSEDLHAARGSTEIFTKAKNDIERHFRARDIYDELIDK